MAPRIKPDSVHDIHRGRVKLSIEEFVAQGIFRWRLKITPAIMAHEILPAQFADQDNVIDAIALLHDAQEWLARRRKEIAKLREAFSERPLQPPSWVKYHPYKTGNYEDLMRKRYARSN